MTCPPEPYLRLPPVFRWAQMLVQLSAERYLPLPPVFRWAQMLVQLSAERYIRLPAVFRWTQMLVELSTAHGLPPGMVTYLAAPTAEQASNPNPNLTLT